MSTKFTINTLHRGKYMLSFFVFLFIMGGLGSLIPAKEIVKIVIVLFTIPITLYISVKLSKNSSVWELTEKALTIHFAKKTISYSLDDIDHIRSLTRSGGTLYIIYFKTKSPARYWRNKLFQEEDDQLALQQSLMNSTTEYYKF